MIIDNTQLASVGILSEFLRGDSPRWQYIKTAGDRTDVFRKVAISVRDVAWHEQPWTAAGRPFVQRVTNRLAELGVNNLG